MKKLQIFLPVLLIIMVIATAFGAEIQIPAGDKGGWNPKEQKPISYQAKDGSVLTIAGEVNNRRLVISRSGKQPVSIALPYEVYHVDSIAHITDNRVALIGAVGGGLTEIDLANVQQHRIVDKFSAYKPAPSPDGRFIAFVKFYPTNPGADVSDIVEVYYTTLPPSANRPIARFVTPDDPSTVGTAVYPPDVKTQDSNMYLPKVTDYYHVMSHFFWTSDSSEFVFAAEHQIPAQKKAYDFKKRQDIMPEYNTALDLVSVDTTLPNKPKISIYRVDVCRSSSCFEKLNSIKFEKNGIKAYFKGFLFKGRVHRSVQVKYNQFHAP